MPLGHLNIVGEMSIEVFCPFSDWVVCVFDIELHELLVILEMNPLSVASVANMFSHSKGGLFLFFMVSLAVQKL